MHCAATAVWQITGRNGGKSWSTEIDYCWTPQSSAREQPSSTSHTASWPCRRHLTEEAKQRVRAEQAENVHRLHLDACHRPRTWRLSLAGARRVQRRVHMLLERLLNGHCVNAPTSANELELIRVTLESRWCDKTQLISMKPQKGSTHR